MYKLKVSIEGNPCAVIRLADNVGIPFDNGNSDYQEYLKWLDGYELVGREWVQTKPEGNTPLPAEL